MKKTIIIILSLVLLVGLGFLIYFLVNQKKDLVLQSENKVGVWWWDKELGDEYLTFAKDNDVDEIYYCDYNLNEKTYNFVKKAKKLGIKVYALWGECEWIFDDSGLDALFEKYYAYNDKYDDAKLAGVHLDIEPHQLDEFGDNRDAIMQRFVELVSDVTTENNDISIDFDIPFWAHDMISFGTKKQPVFAHVIDMADRVFVMSYRDEAADIKEVASEEIDYAKRMGKTIALSVAMTSSEGDKVSFQEEGKQVLYAEIAKLEDLVDIDYVLSLHHIETWKKLKEN